MAELLGFLHAPLVIVLRLDHTEGVPGPGLGHLAHSDQGVILRVILQNVIRVVTIIAIATCNYVIPLC